MLLENKDAGMKRRQKAQYRVQVFRAHHRTERVLFICLDISSKQRIENNDIAPRLHPLLVNDTGSDPEHIGLRNTHGGRVAHAKTASGPFQQLCRMHTEDSG